jgi:hypothetical protein
VTGEGLSRGRSLPLHAPLPASPPLLHARVPSVPRPWRSRPRARPRAPSTACPPRVLRASPQTTTRLSAADGHHLVEAGGRHGGRLPLVERVLDVAQHDGRLAHPACVREGSGGAGAARRVSKLPLRTPRGGSALTLAEQADLVGAAAHDPPRSIGSQRAATRGEGRAGCSGRRRRAGRARENCLRRAAACTRVHAPRASFSTIADCARPLLQAPAYFRVCTPRCEALCRPQPRGRSARPPRTGGTSRRSRAFRPPAARAPRRASRLPAVRPHACRQVAPHAAAHARARVSRRFARAARCVQQGARTPDARARDSFCPLARAARPPASPRRRAHP